METMNVGSSFMHEDITIEAYEEYEDIDEEGEGLIEPCHSGRSANYTIYSGGQVSLQDMVDNWNGSNNWYRSKRRHLLEEDEGVLRRQQHKWE
jgi:hypothetical protein